MKLYDGKLILPALGLFLAVAALPFWRSAVARGAGFRSPPNPEGLRCVEPHAVMRAEHMRLLARWRDEVVRADDRIYAASDGRRWEKSLVKTCLGCHGPANATGKPTTAAAECGACHAYVNVKLDCWNCHCAAAPLATGKTLVSASGAQEERR
jgi:hypothetical protein